ncbi:GIY-YIG nuclease family protein [uncultured Paraglaciecola sp.]|uniref:GIY-YIG nuclease family protein n=1 Tax=uncultured Paraglaciecola sp. TaxID=1765024 RepID=UPI00262D900B|nr:GIY-YIG nuclease family protein [uncultured Paraglaciecola sp.]
MSKGYVYVLSNPVMPGIVKIGRSMHGGKGRADALYRNDTGVAKPFVVEHEIYVKDCVALEKAVHAAFSMFRINKSREFFETTPDRVFFWLMAHLVTESGGEVSRKPSDPGMAALREFTEYFGIGLLAYQVATHISRSSVCKASQFDQIETVVKEILSDPHAAELSFKEVAARPDLQL